VAKNDISGGESSALRQRHRAARSGAWRAKSWRQRRHQAPAKISGSEKWRRQKRGGINNGIKSSAIASRGDGGGAEAAWRANGVARQRKTAAA